jgi:hypothetical protein
MKKEGTAFLAEAAISLAGIRGSSSSVRRSTPHGTGAFLFRTGIDATAYGRLPLPYADQRRMGRVRSFSVRASTPRRSGDFLLRMRVDAT